MVHIKHFSRKKNNFIIKTHSKQKRITFVSIGHPIARKQCRNCNVPRPSDPHLSWKCVYLSEIACHFYLELIDDTS